MCDDKQTAPKAWCKNSLSYTKLDNESDMKILDLMLLPSLVLIGGFSFLCLISVIAMS
jgi:hypothetical protein